MGPVRAQFVGMSQAVWPFGYACFSTSMGGPRQVCEDVSQSWRRWASPRAFFPLEKALGIDGSSVKANAHPKCFRLFLAPWGLWRFPPGGLGAERPQRSQVFPNAPSARPDEWPPRVARFRV